MGKISITGQAEREVKYDAMEIIVRFLTHAESSSQAIKQMMEQSEDFLKTMHEAGVEMEQMILGNNNVNQQYWDNKLQVSATREVKMSLGFNMEFLNYIMELMHEKAYAVDIDSNFQISNLKDIHEELLLEALEDSRHKAELIAKRLGQSIRELDSASVHSNVSPLAKMSRMADNEALMGSSNFQYSNEIGAPTVKESRTIEAVWLVE